MSDSKNLSSPAGAVSAGTGSGEVSRLTSRDAALLIMRADMASGKATKRSLGTMYGFVMAGSQCSGPDFWRPINEAIMEYGPKSANRFAFLEGVKKVAWNLFEEAAKATRPVDEPADRAQSAGAQTPTTEAR